jgi:hypothetical protein
MLNYLIENFPFGKFLFLFNININFYLLGLACILKMKDTSSIFHSNLFISIGIF